MNGYVVIHKYMDEGKVPVSQCFVLANNEQEAMALSGEYGRHDKDRKSQITIVSLDKVEDENVYCI